MNLTNPHEGFVRFFCTPGLFTKFINEKCKVLQSKAVRLLVSLTLISGIVVVLLLVHKASMGQLKTLDSAEEIIMDALLRYSDFPDGWREGALLNRDVAGALGRAVTFRGSRDPIRTWVNTSEEIYRYSTTKAAEEAYSGWSAEYFPTTTDAWLHAAKIDFLNNADQVTTGCLPVSINGESIMGCRIVARYDNLVIVVIGNTATTGALTDTDFRKVLEAADQRVMKALAEQK
jgi:hypothetical protein